MRHVSSRTDAVTAAGRLGRGGGAPRRALIHLLHRATRQLARLQPPSDRRAAAHPIHYTPELVLYVAALACLAVGLASITITPPPDIAGLVIAAVVIFGLTFGSAYFGRSQFVVSASTFLHLGLAVTLGPLGAAVGAITESGSVALKHHTHPFRFVFNISNHFLSNLAAWAAFSGVQHWQGRETLVLTVAGLAAGFAQLLVNLVALAMVIALSTSTSFLRRLRDSFTVANYNAFYGIGAIAFVTLHRSLGAFAFVVLAAPLIAIQVFLRAFAAQVSAHERTEAALRMRVERSYDATLIALAHALDARDRETEGHSRRVVEYTRIVAVRLGISPDDVEVLARGALLHDIGKIGVPDAILHKPGALTEEEWQVMRRHPEMGAVMIGEVEQLVEARRIILHHHERWDGAGYPRGLRGLEIAPGARVFAVADAFDAITQDRPYRRGASFDQAREELVRQRGRQFDPDAVDALLAIEESSLLRIAAMRRQVATDLLSGASAPPPG